MATHEKYLIIDDSEIDRIVTSRLLKVRLGANDIFFAGNGVAGLESITAHRSEFNESLVILLDVRMPEMDGFGFLEAFDKLDDALKKITRIFMLSSTLDSDDIERAKKYKIVKSLLGKPLHIDELIVLLKRGEG